MLIKFESKRAAPFIMQSPIAEQVLKMAGQCGKTQGLISGAAILEAIASLEESLAEQPTISEESITEKEEQEHISLNARVAPLREMLRHAAQIDSYVMWRLE